MSLGPDSVGLERRRDSRQWIRDWVIKQSGRTHNFEYDARSVPAEVKSHAMIPRAMHKLAAHCESIARAAGERGHGEMASPRFKQIFMYMAGLHDEDEFDRMAAQMHLRGYAARIRCPC